MTDAKRGCCVPIFPSNSLEKEDAKEVPAFFSQIPRFWLFLTWISTSAAATSTHFPCRVVAAFKVLFRKGRLLLAYHHGKYKCQSWVNIHFVFGLRCLTMRSQKPFCEKEIADSAKILSEEDEIPSYTDLSVFPTLHILRIHTYLLSLFSSHFVSYMRLLKMCWWNEEMIWRNNHWKIYLKLKTLNKG